MPDEPVIYRSEVITTMWLIGDLTFAMNAYSNSWRVVVAKKKTTRTDFSEIDMHLRVLRELVDRGWAELRVKAEAEGKPLPVDPRRV